MPLTPWISQMSRALAAICSAAHECYKTTSWWNYFIMISMKRLLHGVVWAIADLIYFQLPQTIKFLFCSISDIPDPTAITDDIISVPDNGNSGVIDITNSAQTLRVSPLLLLTFCLSMLHIVYQRLPLIQR